MTLWVVRHAKPLLPAGTCYGRLDVPAHAADTQTAAQALAHALPQQARLRYSPLQRCALLAQRLCALRPDVAAHAQPDARLQEMDFGQHEGRTWTDIGPAALQAWTDDFADHRFGGGETVREFMARVAGPWGDYLHAAHAHSAPPATVWICHAGVGRAASLLARGVHTVARAQDWPVQGLAFGAWMCVQPEAAGA